MNFKDMKISTRLAFGFGILTLLIALIASVAIIKTDDLDDDLDRVVNDCYVKIAVLNEIKSDLNVIARSVRNAVILSNPDDVKAELNRVESTRKAIAEQWAVLEPKVRSEKGRELLAKTVDAGSKYEVVRAKFVSQVTNGKIDEAKAMLLGELRPVQVVYFAIVDEFIAHQKQVMDESAQKATSAVAKMKAIFWATGCVALVIAVLLGIWITRAITRPLGQAGAIARAVADGDLSMQFDVEGKNETAQLLLALKEMQGNLAKVVSHVRHNAEALASATAQIANGNSDLAQRTEEQAASLEETAASMEELTGTVRQNADNANQARMLTTTASDIAQRGGEVVGRVVETMQGISDSSGKVAEIISVIESISFQTNILALNAAVEAARAGEQGRGFAVVAGEIRALAQRSAMAAKEIQELISESVTRVDAGSKLVDEAGSTMTQVVQAVKRVTDIMGEIAAASSEQSTGIEQVNTAVIQMDQMTQQNAALVEEASAAAQSLAEQAEDLRKEVAVFKVGSNASGGATFAMTAAPSRPAVAKSTSLVAANSTPRRESEPASAVSEWETF